MKTCTLLAGQSATFEKLCQKYLYILKNAMWKKMERSMITRDLYILKSTPRTIIVNLLKQSPEPSWSLLNGACFSVMWARCHSVSPRTPQSASECSIISVFLKRAYKTVLNFHIVTKRLSFIDTHTTPKSKKTFELTGYSQRFSLHSHSNVFWNIFYFIYYKD